MRKHELSETSSKHEERTPKSGETLASSGERSAWSQAASRTASDNDVGCAAACAQADVAATCANHNIPTSKRRRKTTLRALRAVAMTRQRREKASPFTGVTRAGQRWRCKIFFNGRSVSVGHFNDEQMAAMAYDIAAHELDVTRRSLNFTLDELNAKAPASLFEHVKRVVQNTCSPQAAAGGVAKMEKKERAQPRHGSSAAPGKITEESRREATHLQRDTCAPGSRTRRLPPGNTPPGRRAGWDASLIPGSQAASQLTLAPRCQRTKRPRSDNLDGHGGSSASEAGVAPATSRRRLWPSNFDGTQFQASRVRAALHGVAFVPPCGAQGVSPWFQAAYRSSESMHHLPTHSGVGSVHPLLENASRHQTAMIPHFGAAGAQYAPTGILMVHPSTHHLPWYNGMHVAAAFGAVVGHQAMPCASGAASVDPRAWLASVARGAPTQLSMSMGGTHGVTHSN